MITQYIVSTRERTTEEEELINAARKDVKAFVAIYDHYFTAMYRYLFSRVGNQQDAEDLTSQVFITAFERFGQYKSRGKPFAAWLFTIARNKTIDFFRTKHNDAFLDEIQPSAELDPLDDVCKASENQMIFDLIAALPAEDRELLHLRFGGEMTYEQIACLLKRNKDAVKKQIYRLLERIGKKMEDTYETTV